MTPEKRKRLGSILLCCLWIGILLVVAFFVFLFPIICVVQEYGWVKGLASTGWVGFYLALVVCAVSVTVNWCRGRSWRGHA